MQAAGPLPVELFKKGSWPLPALCVAVSASWDILTGSSLFLFARMQPFHQASSQVTPCTPKSSSHSCSNHHQAARPPGRGFAAMGVSWGFATTVQALAAASSTKQESQPQKHQQYSINTFQRQQGSSEAALTLGVCCLRRVAPLSFRLFMACRACGAIQTRRPVRGWFRCGCSSRWWAQLQQTGPRNRSCSASCKCAGTAEQSKVSGCAHTVSSSCYSFDNSCARPLCASTAQCCPGWCLCDTCTALREGGCIGTHHQAAPCWPLASA